MLIDLINSIVSLGRTYRSILSQYVFSLKDYNFFYYYLAQSIITGICLVLLLECIIVWLINIVLFSPLSELDILRVLKTNVFSKLYNNFTFYTAPFSHQQLLLSVYDFPSRVLRCYREMGPLGLIKIIYKSTFN